MPFDGNGNWTSDYYPQAGELIKASDFNNTFVADLANAFGNCVTRDGQGVMQTNTDANNYRVVNVADPVLSMDAVNKRTVTKLLPDLFDHKFVDYELNSEVWLKADNFSWQDGTVYSEAYNHLVDDIENITSQTETIDGYTITFYLANDGHKIVKEDQEQVVQNIFNSCGIAWYYILDTTNQKFKLPRTKFGFTGSRGNVGGYVEAGAPNITGILYGVGGVPNSGGVTASGAFSVTQKTGTGMSTAGSDAYADAAFNASSSSDVYGNSTTVQPPATEMYLYFYVGQFTKTATEQTAGITTAQLNAKVDLDGGNATFKHIVETYSNGSNWYRIWSDGWCEQGGHIAEASTSAVATVTLNHTFKDTNYIVVKSWYAKGTSFLNASYDATASVYNSTDKTTSAFTTFNLTGWDGFDWYACGYITQGE